MHAPTPRTQLPPTSTLRSLPMKRLRGTSSAARQNLKTQRCSQCFLLLLRSLQVPYYENYAVSVRQLYPCPSSGSRRRSAALRGAPAAAALWGSKPCVCGKEGKIHSVTVALWNIVALRSASHRTCGFAVLAGSGDASLGARLQDPHLLDTSSYLLSSCRQKGSSRCG